MIANRLSAALAALHDAERQLREAVKGLPPYPAGRCCEKPDLRVVTECLAQVCYAQWCDGALSAMTDGWDDLGDMVGPEYLSCNSCDGHFHVPADVEWS